MRARLMAVCCVLNMGSLALTAQTGRSAVGTAAGVAQTAAQKKEKEPESQ